MKSMFVQGLYCSANLIGVNVMTVYLWLAILILYLVLLLSFRTIHRA